jgi:hypothetical protein
MGKISRNRRCRPIDILFMQGVYLQTTSIFHDVSRKRPVTLGFSALHVMDFPSSSVVGTKLNSLIVTFSRVSC